MSSIYILLDSSFLTLPFVKKMNLQNELDRVLGRGYKLVTISPVLRELQGLALSNRPSQRRKAVLALKLIERLGVEVLEVPLEAKVDNSIVKVATAKKWLVATNDRELRRKLREEGIPTVYLRARKHLAIDEEV